jgi:hypothetical protein
MAKSDPLAPYAELIAAINAMTQAQSELALQILGPSQEKRKDLQRYFMQQWSGVHDGSPGDKIEVKATYTPDKWVVMVGSDRDLATIFVQQDEGDRVEIGLRLNEHRRFVYIGTGQKLTITTEGADVLDYIIEAVAGYDVGPYT